MFLIFFKYILFWGPYYMSFDETGQIRNVCFQKADWFLITIISKMPFWVVARWGHGLALRVSPPPLPIMMIWNQFRCGTGYLTEFWVILNKSNKFKSAQKRIFWCCLYAVHLNSLHLLTDGVGMMTYWKWWRWWCTCWGWVNNCQSQASVQKQGRLP